MSTSTSSQRAAAVAPAAATGTRRRGGIHGVTSAFWIFVGPFVFGLIVFVYLPIIWSVVLSFSRAQNTVTPGDWVGLQNYVDLLRPGPFVDSLITFTIFAAFIVPLTFALSIERAGPVARVTASLLRRWRAPENSLPGTASATSRPDRSNRPSAGSSIRRRLRPPAAGFARADAGSTP